MRKFEIKHRYNDSILWSGNAESLKDAVELAIKNKTDLSYANLSYADLCNANLTNANLRNADLYKANLSYANLRDVDLSYANLIYANLSDADLYKANLRDTNLTNVDLSYANLSDANLYKANLSDANLNDANLNDADLSYANLRNADLSNADLRNAILSYAKLSDADLSKIKEDFLSIITFVPDEVLGLKQALVDGKVDGMIYEGECACLIGTIANLKHCNYKQIPNLVPNSQRPSEHFFLAIKKDDTPNNNQVSKIVVEWVDEFLKNQ